MNKELVTMDSYPYFSTVNDPAWSLNALSNNTENNYWEPFFYLCLRRSLESLGYTVTVKKFEDIDKSRPWFINLKIIGHAWGNHPGVFSVLPNEWLQQLNSGNAYLIINNEDEYWTESLLKIFYYQFKKDPAIPLHKILIISGASLIHDVHKRYCKENKIVNPVKILFSPHMNVLFNEGDLKFLLRPDQPVKTKKFNTLNREWRLHRPSFVAMLAGLKILDQGHLSLGASSIQIKQANDNGGWKKYLLDTFNAVKNANPRPYNDPVFKLILQGIEIIHDRIPICLDQSEFDTNYAKWEYTPVDYMKDSYFHVCSSTFFFKWEEESPGWHEKEWKPILIKQPFIIKGRPGMLKLLRRFGFLTFDKWIDESYDEIENDWDRLYAIAKETERLCAIPDQQWDAMLVDMQNTLDFNYEVLINKKWDLFFFGGELKNLISYL